MDLPGARGADPARMGDGRALRSRQSINELQPLQPALSSLPLIFLPWDVRLISSLISRTSAGFLALVGLVLLFASDEVLPHVVPDVPATASWIGQLIAAGWLGLAVLNWVSRSALLGGIYGRPVVLTNALFYFIGATTLLKVMSAQEHLAVLRWIAGPVAMFAGVYGWLLFRGPIRTDFARARGAFSESA